MSAYPIMLDGASVSALIVGGGAVAARKAAALLAAGARVHVVAPAIAPAFASLAAEGAALRMTRATYDSAQLGDVSLVFAATDDASVNARVAADARARGLLVNVADAPELGTFSTPAVHRDGDLVVAVGAGGVPAAAARVRDGIRASLDGRESFAGALQSLGEMRRSLLEAGDRDAWHRASSELIGETFCDDVRSGAFGARLAAWR